MIPLQKKIEKKIQKSPLPVLQPIRSISRYRLKKEVVAETYYPGCKIFISRNPNSGWQVSATNRDPGKIKTEDVETFFKAVLDEQLGDQRSVKRGLNIDFRLESVCLENWRDIWAGRIQELIDDEHPQASCDKVGAFGFLQGTSKPERIRFAQLADEHPDRFEYIPTDKYSSSMKNYITLLEYKRRFKYVIDLPGHTYSTKIYWMMFLKRPIFYVEPNQKFLWETRLKPWVHYIPVRRDYGDLMSHYEWAESNPERVEEISEALYEFGMREMSPTQVVDNFVDRIRSCSS